MKHNLSATANATALTVGIVYLVCAFSVLLVPDLVLGIARTWFHGVSLTEVASAGITPGSFVLGLVSAMVGGWVLGYLFAYFYNLFARK